MIIYSNGCSHTAGHCIRHVHTWPTVLMKSVVLDKNYEVNTIREKLDIKMDILFNKARHGAGNDFIFHKSLEHISELLEKDMKPDYAIIQWSGPNRRTHCLPDGTELFVNLYDNVKYGVKFEPMASEHTLHYMFTMQEFLKKNKINYCFFNYMALDETIKKLKIFNLIDFDRFAKFNFIENENIILIGLLDYFKKNNLVCDDVGHPNAKGNFLIAREVSKIIGIDLIDETDFYKNTNTLI